MPITNLTSYLPTMQAFVEHWTEVNNALGAKPLVLADGTSLIAFSGTRAAIQTAITAVTQIQAQLPPKRLALINQKKALSKKLELFRKAVTGQLANSTYVLRLPTLPDFNATQSRFIKPLEAAATIWSSINTMAPAGFTPPLILSDGTVLADFQAAIASLYTAYSAINTAQVKINTALSQRDAYLPAARNAMRQYRIVVFARLAPTDPLLTRVPRLSPVPGSTPKPVTNLLFFYNETTNILKITFDPATSKNTLKYQALFCPGPKWNAGNTTIVDTNDNLAPFVFEFKYVQVGVDETGLFKVVTLNMTENTRASKVLKIKRTVAGTLTLQLAA